MKTRRLTVIFAFLAWVSIPFVSAAEAQYSITPLGGLGGVPLNGRISTPTGISNNGDITGQAADESGKMSAFLFHNGVMSNLGAWYPYAINDSSQIVGWDTSSGNYHAVFYSNGVLTDLGTFGGTASSAWSLNNK